jgi:hypothetical protein
LFSEVRFEKIETLSPEEMTKMPRKERDSFPNTYRGLEKLPVIGVVSSSVLIRIGE